MTSSSGFLSFFIVIVVCFKPWSVSCDFSSTVTGSLDLSRLFLCFILTFGLFRVDIRNILALPSQPCRHYSSFTLALFRLIPFFGFVCEIGLSRRFWLLPLQNPLEFESLMLKQNSGILDLIDRISLWLELLEDDGYWNNVKVFLLWHSE